ncbi:Vacuolar (H+)-ATPase G subunit [Corchorus olitorius]|uniref:Vacuolar (H+)-ATPase G subunit n=1 Tax=Corchorus olitorius TaxID=93759 RepID=A0A1R3HT36_9ROSI|nr:Vacuolar (H+)-ATPase G subunit [Corchorus olitorius]
MEASRGQGGIQQLLAAEQEAQHIVNAARNGNHSFSPSSQICRLDV